MPLGGREGGGREGEGGGRITPSTVGYGTISASSSDQLMHLSSIS